ncbi:MAG: ribbon-helix-helix protein, CopG family [Deltaproteobacteria bacterium]|nr:ribbon-helix-helix protein, CopG family [Deltaproteobacteria bacterium]NND27785.1 ribbon-helix-helix protein, CopG family [Myxococcales bacterium]MBT8463851.1 ribbon-helix-helix protein, CopG family [Deltaproteobacteria bacterium]MBT8481225.1 ribbon-helix-helix protein, CopG family [Deltaproteobacteria bacterium]NNK06123.1 ribbon-helix-helix protein, CopG family [Myxococcales bacterium]
MTIRTNDPVQVRKPKSRIVFFRVDEDGFARLDALARETSCSRGEVLRRCLRDVRPKSTVDAQALSEVSRIHANLNRLG